MTFKNSVFEFSAIKVRRSGEFSKSLTRNIALSSTSVSEDVQLIRACSGVSISSSQGLQNLSTRAPVYKHDPSSAKIQQLADG